MSLVAHDVAYSYRRPPAAGDGFSLEPTSLNVTPGSITGLLGPNGCGKTTLLNLLAGILTPTGGSVLLDDRPLARMSRREIARRLAMVPQYTHPAFDYTALQIVLMGRHPHLGTFQLEGPDDEAIASDALRSTSAAHLAHRLYSTLSGGEKQRVVIASALAQTPSVLLLDEPTASLDLGHQFEVVSVLAGLRQRAVTMVVATHDLNLAAGLCERLVLMRDGRIVAQGPTGEVLTGEVIRRVYGVEADVAFHEGAGRLSVVPLRQAQS